MIALLLSPILVPLVTALSTSLLAARPVAQRRLGLVGITAFFACAAALLAHVATEGTLRASMGGWPAPFGIELVADPLGAAMVLITALMGASALVFQLSDADAAPSAPSLEPLVHAMLAAVSGAFLTGDIFNLYVWFELMLVSSLGLLAYRTATRQLDATLKYFVLNTVGTLLLLVGIAYLHAATGHLGFGALSEAARDHDALRLAPFVVMVALAFLVKAGAFPLYAWLPASYHTLPAPLLALFAGLLTKVGVYALLRVLGGVFVLTPSLVFEALGWVAAATMLFGVLGAAYHWDVRRILAFHIISQIGYMLLGIALASREGHVGTVFYVIHHIVVKANLFLIAAIIFRHTGSYDLRRSGGLYAVRPGLAALFAIPALSLVGIPPLSGFWAKLLVVRETLAQGRWGLAAIALFVGLLTLYSMAKIWFGAFWKKHPDEGWRPAEGAHLGPAYLATGALALVTLYLGLAPEGLVRLAELASAELVGGPR
ncbi:MAG: Na+/H+ antiporter subunit D [Myxococcales bacterium]|nr:Na+/H+ antiporter subunit D [Myxococcales bacterium]